MAGPHTNARIVVRGTALATGEARIKNIYNVYDFVRTSPSGTPSKTNMKAAFKTSILTPLGNCLSVSYVKNTIDIRFIDDYLDPFQQFVDGINGQVAGDSLPSLVNATLQLQTGVRGKHYRGFKHYGPIAESHTTLDYINGTGLALWTTFTTAYLAGFTDSDGFIWKPFVVAARLSNLKVATPVVVTTPVTTIITNSDLGRMTRRAQFHKSAA